MNGLSARKCQIEYFDTLSPASYIELGKCIVQYMSSSNITECTPVILCIGTDRATGDCLGPLVGEKLIDFSSKFTVMGCLSAPVHALNLREVIRTIQTEIDNPFVIAVDAALGNSSHVGLITVSDCPIAPGRGVNKKLPAIGDISITGIVNVSGQSANLLQSTRLHLVMQLADCIAEALKYSINYLEDFCPL